MNTSNTCMPVFVSHDPDLYVNDAVGPSSFLLFLLCRSSSSFPFLKKKEGRKEGACKEEGGKEGRSQPAWRCPDLDPG